MANERPGLQGSWLGNYYYENATPPHAFEAVFAEHEGLVEGHILDDGQLGEAKIAGSFSYPRLSFQKRYNNAALEPVLYEGQMSDDGKKIAGSWHMSQELKGTWTAWRIDGEELPDISDTEENEEELEKELVRERVFVRPIKKTSYL